MTTVEYGLILGLAGILALAGLVAVRSALTSNFTATIEGAGVVTCAASDPSCNVYGALPTPTAVTIGVAAPGAPVLTAATSGVEKVTVSWTAPTTGGAPTGYLVTAVVEADSSIAGYCSSVSSLTCVVNGLASGTSYSFTAKASNSGGSSPASNALTATPTGSTSSAPDAPTGLTAAPGPSEATLTWTAPADNGSAISDYIVQYKRGSASTWQLFADGTSVATSATVTGLTPGITYDFQVAAKNGIGTGSFSSPATTHATGACVTLAAVAVTNAGSATATVPVLPSDLSGGAVTATSKSSAANTGTLVATTPAGASVSWSGYTGSKTWTGTYSYSAANCTGTAVGSSLSVSSN